jgi:hypothetical protein
MTDAKRRRPARSSFLLLVVAIAVAAGCRSAASIGAARSAGDEAADLLLLCDPPKVSDPPKDDETPSMLLRAFPAAAGYEILSERLKSSRWRRWLQDVDTTLSKKTADAAGARRKADELDSAAQSAGHSSCWAAARIRRFMEK